MCDFQEICEELSYRVGEINLNNDTHLLALVHILRENNWTEEAIDGLLTNLTTDNQVITEITKRDLQTRIVSMGSGLGSHSNLGRVKNDNDISDADFIKLIKKT